MQKFGRRIRSGDLLLVYAEGTSVQTRVGLTVSGKVGNAVVRNRIKRWLREVVRMVPAPRNGPWDLVLIPRPEAGAAGLWALREHVQGAFARVRR